MISPVPEPGLGLFRAAKRVAGLALEDVLVAGLAVILAAIVYVLWFAIMLPLLALAGAGWAWRGGRQLFGTVGMGK